jgi:hypothetical protein
VILTDLMMVACKYPDLFLHHQVLIADTTGLMMVGGKCPGLFP